MSSTQTQSHRFLWCLIAAMSVGASSAAATTILAPGTMPKIGTVDERYQSYNVEMIEVTGGRFWKPYKDIGADSGLVSGFSDSTLYAYRRPTDLTNPRLRVLAAALGPAYMRVSGTWANSTWFDAADEKLRSPPAGFNSVLTRDAWQNVIDFARAADAKLVTSFAVSPGTRDARGVWTRANANELIAFTKTHGGEIAAAEFMNEPNLAATGGAPKGYDAANFGRDIAVFKPFLKSVSPDTTFLGPGSVGESGSQSSSATALTSENLMAVSGPVFDAISYHYYGAVSERCAKAMPNLATREEDALSERWLSGTDRAEGFFVSLRDKFEPGRPLWLTETAEAACGGNRWASTFLDSFRYLDQLGRLARRGVQVVMHNTLAASDYGLIDESDTLPRPNYWAALLWRRLMGTVVLDAGTSPAAGLHLYAHCLRGTPGGVAVLAINTATSSAALLHLSSDAEQYTLTARALTDSHVLLNGAELALGPRETLPALEGFRVSGDTSLAPASIAFLAFGTASNPACL